MKIDTGRKNNKVNGEKKPNKWAQDGLNIKFSKHAPVDIGGVLPGLCEGVKLEWFWTQGQGIVVHRHTNPLILFTWVDDDASIDVLDLAYPVTPRQMTRIQEIVTDCMEAEREILKRVRELARAFAIKKIAFAIKDPDDPDKFFDSQLYKELIKECIIKVRISMEMDGPAWDDAFIHDNDYPLCTYADEIETAVMHALQRSFNVRYKVKRGNE